MYETTVVFNCIEVELFPPDQDGEEKVLCDFRLKKLHKNTQMPMNNIF